MNRKTFVSSLVAIGITALSLQPASAQSLWDVQNFLRNLGGAGGGYGQVNSNINVGLSNASSQIQAKVSSGQMSPATASMLQAQINDIASMSASMGADGRFSSGEVNQLLSQMANLNQQIDSSTGYAPYGSYGTYVGYNPYFNDYNSVYNYQQQLLNQINAARFSAAQRAAYRNEYNSIAPYLNRRYLSNNYNNNQYVKRMVRLQQRIRENQRIADRSDRRDDRHRWH